MKRILVTVDFNGTDVQSLLDMAMELAIPLQSKVWIVHIAAPDPDFVGYEAGPQSVRDTRASELRGEHKKLQEYANLLVTKGINAESLLIQGSTIETIIEESKKLNIDLIIAGHSEHGFLYNALFGSVSEAVVKKSKIPVLLVPVE